MSDKHQKQEKSAPETAEELVSLAREYFANEFPNSGRGCPSRGEIVKIIKSGQLPDDALRKHLLTCSKCFVTYREHLQSSQDVQPIRASLGQRIYQILHNPWLRVLVPGVPVILVAVLLTIFYFGQKNPQEKTTAVNSPVESANANANVQTTASLSPVQSDASKQIERATHIVRVDLRNYSPQRGNDTGADPPPLEIQQKPTAFTITLPEGSPPGTYSVSILNAFGKTVKTRTSSSSDGKRLTATLNLDNLKDQKYRLCVSRADEPPNCYPIVITNRGKQTQ